MISKLESIFMLMTVLMGTAYAREVNKNRVREQLLLK